MENIPKNANIFSCHICDFKCYKKSNYDTHLQTTKHINRTKLNNLEQKNAKKVFICGKCNKEYNVRNSLWYHEKKCDYEKQIDKETQLKKETIIDNKENKDEIINLLLTQNKELMDLIKSGIIYNNTTNNNSHNTTNNNTFNLNFFLN
jgi:hypothetical protein